MDSRSSEAIRERLSGAGPLDPVQNKSNQHLPGEKKREWLRSWKDPAWGVAGSWCGSMTVLKRLPTGTLIAPVLCHRWACGQCGPQRAAWLKRQLQEAVARGDVSHFWTLTVRTSQCSPEESYGFIAACWDRLRASLRKKYGPFEFVWTREVTKAGYAHLHLLTSLDVPHEELSRLWLKATGGSWVVDVQPIESERAGSYLAKYCTEQAMSRPLREDGTKRRDRIFSKSKGIQFEPFITPSEGDVVLSLVPWRDAVACVEREGHIKTSKLRGSPWLLVSDDLLGPDRGLESLRVTDETVEVLE